MSKYLQVVWLYVIGLLIILLGVYLLALNSGPGSFFVMLVGLGIAAIGSAHGRKMRQGGQYGFEDFMKEGGEPVPGGIDQKAPDVPAQGEAGPVETGPAQPAEQQPAEMQQEEAPPGSGGGFLGFLRRPAGPIQLREEDVMQIEMEDIKSGRLVPTEADVIELVCPNCGAENDDKNYYCYSCGTKLRRKPSKDAKEKKPMKIEPGSIAVVGDRRVAKVVICPKCNAANKQSDKFCFNCGKKLRAQKAQVLPKARRQPAFKADKLFKIPKPRKGKSF